MDIDWASDDETKDNGTESVPLSQVCKTNILHATVSGPSTERVDRPSASVSRARTVAKTASMRKCAGGRRCREPVSLRRQNNTVGESTQQDVCIYVPLLQWYK